MNDMSLDNGPRLGLINWGSSSDIDASSWLDIVRSECIRQPEHNLMFRLIEDAKQVLLLTDATTPKAQENRQRKKGEFLEGMDKPQSEYIFSFINCCETLGLEPSRVRKDLKALISFPVPILVGVIDGYHGTMLHIAAPQNGNGHHY